MRLRCCCCPVDMFGGLAGGVPVEIIMSFSVLSCWSGSLSVCLSVYAEGAVHVLSFTADMLKGDTSCRGCI